MYLIWKTVAFCEVTGCCASSLEVKKTARARRDTAREKLKSMEMERLMSATAAIFMAVVAGGGTVAETRDIGVARNLLRLSVKRGGVAIDAGEAGVVGGDLVAITTNGTVMWNGEIRMVESCVQPSGGGVACI